MIQKIIKDTLQNLAEKKAIEMEGVKYKPKSLWRSSGLGSCMRGRFITAIMDGKIAPNHDERTEGVFRMGHIVERSLLHTLVRQDDYYVITQGEMENVQMNLSGHFDILLINKKTLEPFLVECKSKNSRAFSYMKDGAQIQHRMQWISYRHMINHFGFSFAGTGGSYASNAIVKIDALEEVLKLSTGEDFENIETELLILKKNYEAFDFLHKQGLVLFDGSGAELPKSLAEGCIFYISKDDYRIAEYPIKYNDEEARKLFFAEIATLNDCIANKKAPPANEEGAWQSKYCQLCQAGLCQNLNDEIVKQLMES